MPLVEELSARVGVQAACAALEVPRASFYRRQSSQTTPEKADARESGVCAERVKSLRALTAEEREAVIARLNSERFMDQSPREVYATLLDEGTYLCSVRTMYRLLAAEGEVKERRDQLRHPTYQKPELLATAANQVWSWDITKLLGPQKWSYFY